MLSINIDSTEEESKILTSLEEISNNHPEIDDIIRSSASTFLESKYGVGWFDKSEAWNDLKTQYDILKEYDNQVLRLLYLRQKPSIIELLTKTPLGPFLMVNLAFLLTGFSWCDTPFGQIESCSP